MVKERNAKGALCDYFSISNGYETLLFKTELLNLTLGKTSALSTTLFKVSLEKGDQGVADQISLLLEYIRSVSTGSDSEISDLMNRIEMCNGKHFITAALESAVDIENNDLGLTSISLKNTPSRCSSESEGTDKRGQFRRVC